MTTPQDENRPRPHAIAQRAHPCTSKRCSSGRRARSEPDAPCLRRYEATTTRRAPIDALTPAGLAVRLIDQARAAFIDGTLGTALGVDVSELKGAPRPRLEPFGSGLVGPADVKPVRPTLSPVPREATLSPVTSEAQGSQARRCPAAAPP
jgi:hypothetical protein